MQHFANDIHTFRLQSDPELDVGVEWVQLVAKQRINPNEKQTYAFKCDEILTHVRLTVFPGMVIPQPLYK